MKKLYLKLALLIALFGIVSCRSTDTVNEKSSAKATIKINLLGVEAENETLLKSASTEKTIASVIQKQIIPFDNKYEIIATLTPRVTSLENLPQASINPIAAKNKTDLKSGIQYKVIVYNSDGSYNKEKIYSYKQNDQTLQDGFELDGGSTYSFIAYSVNNTSSILPPISNGNTLGGAVLPNVSGDLMYFQRKLTLTGGVNNLNMILKHKFSQITTKLDATGIGNVTAINGAIISPINSSGNLKLSDSTLTYNNPITTASVQFPNLNSSVVTSTPTLVISPSTSTASLNIGSVTIAGITRNNLSINNLKITPGFQYNLNLTLNGTLKTIRVLSLTPDDWNSNLSNGTYTNIARSKLNNLNNFGPIGTVRINNFSYTTLDVSAATATQISNAIDNADIIWVSYISNGYLPVGSDKRNVLEQKIAEKKKFFFIGNDNNNGSYFPGQSIFAGYKFDFYGFGTNQISVIAGAGPTQGSFGNLVAGTTIRETRAIGKVISYPNGAIPFLNNPDGSINAVAGNNFITVGDINWYVNYETTDGFYGGSNSCRDTPESIVFCNIFEKAINFLKNNQ